MPIFLSYSRRDAQQADVWVEALERAGYRIWIDRAGIPGGDHWKATVVRSILDAHVFLLLLSPNSAGSEHVRREIDIASDARKRIIPVEIQSTTIPPELRYQLAGTQILRVWSEPRGAVDLVRAALHAAGVKRSGGRIVEADPNSRSSGEANVDLADIGNWNFLSRIAFWRRS